jgi:hypothetical protein
MATDNKKKKYDQLTVPSSIVRYAFVDKPRVTKFNAQGEFSLDVRVSAEYGKGLIEKLRPYAEAVHSEALANAKPGDKDKVRKWTDYLPVEEEKDRDTGEPTGEYVVKMKQAAFIKGKDGNPIALSVPVYDSAKPPQLTKGLKIGRGSVVRSTVQIVPFTSPGGKSYGVTLRLIGVQVVKLVEWTGGRDADSLGFKGDDDGFVADNEPSFHVGDNDHGDAEPTPAPGATSKNPNF